MLPAITVVLLLALTYLATRADGWAAKPRPKWLPKIWWSIGMCETGLNWRHNSGTYQGAFGFHYASWDQFNTFGYPREAYLATPRQQYRVALAIYARYRWTGWGCYTHGGYRYWLGRA